MFRITVLLCLFESFISILFALRGIKELQSQARFVNPFLLFSDTPSMQSETPLWRKAYIQTYITYFRGCYDNSSVSQGNSTSQFYENHLSQRTFEWLVIYLAVNSIWIIVTTSLTLSKDDIRRPKKSFYYLWVLSFTIVIFTDAFASIRYLLDLLQTYDFESYSNFTGCAVDSNLLQWFLDNDYRFFNMAPLLMSLAFSRGIVLWLVNVMVLFQLMKYFHQSCEKDNCQKEANEIVAAIETSASAPECGDLFSSRKKFSDGNTEIPSTNEHYCNVTQSVPLKIDYGSISIRVNKRGGPIRLSFSKPSSNSEAERWEHIELPTITR